MRTHSFLPISLSRIARVLAGLSFVMALAANAQTPLTQLDKMQAAYLFNFSKFTQWPQSAFASEDDNIVVCLDRVNGLADFLRALVKDRVVGEAKRRVQVKALQDAKHCHISFFKQDLMSPLPQLAHSLIVRNQADISVNGHVITFFVVNSKLRFEVDLQELRQRNLNMSSEVLKLARIK